MKSRRTLGLYLLADLEHEERDLVYAELLRDDVTALSRMRLSAAAAFFLQRKPCKSTMPYSVQIRRRTLHKDVRP